jgi:hypothetical protein
MKKGRLIAALKALRHPESISHFGHFHRACFVNVTDDLVDVLRIEIAGSFCRCPEN